MTDQLPLDPFDPKALRLPQDFAEASNVKKLLETIPVGRFNKQDFFRIHPDPEYRLDSVGLLELKDEREYYLVPPSLSADLADEFDPVSLFTCMNRKGVLRLIPTKLPRDDRGRNEWATSLRSGLERGMSQWVRVVPNMSLGAYEISVALNGLPDPVWPDLPFRELLRIAFRDRIIDREDHPVIQLTAGGGMNAAMLLQHAASVIEDRRRTYGAPEPSFADIAARWSLVLGVDVSPAQVALCLIDLKLARLTRDPSHLDSIVDVAGYAALLREVTR